MPAPNGPDKRLTNALFLLGSAAVAFLPLYITRFHGAIDDGALLLIGSVFAADAIFRCLNPLNKRTNWSVFFGVGAVIFLGLTMSEYSPIARKLLQQELAVDSWINTGSVVRLGTLRPRTAEIDPATGQPIDEDTAPNDSIALLIAALAVDLSVIFVVEEK
jgi:hypothetical protein